MAEGIMASREEPAVHDDQGVGSAWWAVAAILGLFALSLFECVNRWAFAAALPRVVDDIGLNPAWIESLATWFLLGFAFVCPFAGYAGDRLRRERLISLGLGLIGVGTLLGGLSRSPLTLALTRVLLGAGGALFGVAALALLSDLCPRERRARAYSGFYLAAPLGGVLGSAVGGWLGAAFGWRLASCLLGGFGLFAALAALRLPDPIRGGSEGAARERLAAHLRVGPSQDDYVDMMVNSSFTYSVMGMAFATFAVSGLASWAPTFLVNAKGFPQEDATNWLALVTFLASVSGLTAGGWLADGLARPFPRMLFLIPGFATLASIPFLLIAIYSTNGAWVYASIFAAGALMFVNVGPCHAIIADVVMPHMRAVGFASALFAGRVFGDLWSAGLMGWVSDTFARRDSMATVFGAWLRLIGAVPTVRPGQYPENLTAGMLVVVPALVISGLVMFAGARHLPREMALMLALLRARPRRPAPPRPASALR